MKQLRVYKGIEYFKIAAALLVIAIHTSPLSSVNDTADFIFTRIIARVAVPFFFMVTGFFVLPKCTQTKYFTTFVKKTSILYLTSILLYIPVNFYAGQTWMFNGISGILKAIIFDGTFYHLWYLPASIMGMGILYILLKYCSQRLVYIITGILYLFGLLGDSYYGIATQVPILKELFNFIFTVSEYTRNGIFMAPAFLLLGYHIRKTTQQTDLTDGDNIHLSQKNVIYIVICTTLLITEALILRNLNYQRHDSMYIMLIPVMYFLFQILLTWKGKSSSNIKTLSLTAYLLHPLAIIILRIFAKLLNKTELLIDNSVVFFISVVIITGIISYFTTLFLNKMNRRTNSLVRNKDKKYTKQHYTKKQMLTENMNNNTIQDNLHSNPCDRAWIEINFSNLENNVIELKKLIPKNCEIMAVVKANAYGHGDIPIAKHLNRIGIHSFAVATLSEGIHLRKNKIEGEILIFGYTHPSEFEYLTHFDLTQTVIDYNYASLLNNYGQKIKVHIKIDTGMNRLGEKWNNIKNLAKIYSFPNLEVKGTYSHLCAADNLSKTSKTYTRIQIDTFDHTLKSLEDLDIKPMKTHIQSSYGVLNYPDLQYDYIRPGIALYGLQSSNLDKTIATPKLLPVLSLKARVSIIKEINAGESIGYSLTFTAKQKMKIAVVTIGYADGIPRNLSNGNTNVIIKGKYAKIIGRVCMDQLEIDITHIPNVTSGDIVTLIGTDSQTSITAEQVADHCNTITNELMSRLGERLERIPTNSNPLINPSL